MVKAEFKKIIRSLITIELQNPLVYVKVYPPEDTGDTRE
jgi:hypothetical protein